MSGIDYDVVVIGGGINGAGVAQAAAAAGHSVLVLEKSHPAAGTSSKSSKLVHGGLRYLESFELGLVRESLQERALLLKLAPDLVQLQEFRIPVYDATRRSSLVLRAGLSLYWLLTGMSASGRFATLPPAQWGQLDGLELSGLRAVFRYNDARTDDAALTRAVLASAADQGAQLEFPAEFVAADVFKGGCRIDYRSQQSESTVTARVLVNAAGPWVSQVAAGITPQQSPVPVALVQGTHIEINGSMSGAFYYLESPRDGRAVFVMPRGKRIIVGTTETRYTGQPDNVRSLPVEENYLLGVLRHYFPQFGSLGRSDLADSWAGLRVLPGGDGHAFHKSRETILATDSDSQPRVLSIYGGKLTTYRTTAEKVVQKIAASLPDRAARASTRELPLRPVS